MIGEAEAQQTEITAELSKAKKHGNLYKEHVERRTQEKEQFEAKLAAESKENCKLYPGWKMS